MELRYSYDPERFHLGGLCKHGHRWPGTDLSLRRTYRNDHGWSYSGCVGCGGAKQRDWLISFIDYEASGFDPGRKLGKLCPKGHRWNALEASLRFSGGSCIECDRLKNAAVPKDVVRERSARYYEKNKEEVAHRNALRWQNISDEERQRRNDHKRKVREELRAQGLTTKGNPPINRSGAVPRATPEQQARRQKTKAIEAMLNALDREILRDQARTPEVIAERKERARMTRLIRYQLDEDFRLYNRQKSKRRKAQERGSIGLQLKGKQVRARFAEFDHRCAYCGATGDMQVEHWIPISRGGTHVLGNILPACQTCNYGKSNADPEAWYRSQPCFSVRRWNKIRRVLGITKGSTAQIPFL